MALSLLHYRLLGIGLWIALILTSLICWGSGLFCEVFWSLCMPLEAGDRASILGIIEFRLNLA